ncbi:MAG: zinc-ribbon domain-containing protein [Clostridia bacterium]|nr:zinc-ribbon domain-containing protein [Clostridia bacterium]
MEDYYCPDCFNKLERLSGCGAVGYMCNTCKHLVSRQKMLPLNEMEKAALQKEEMKKSEE